MSSIFGLLDKRTKAISAAAAVEECQFSFEDRADLLNDLLEEDTTTFPLLACPSEVLAGVLLFLEAAMSVRLRPICSAMRGSVDGNTGLWCSLIARDFADLGGMTKHYKGLRTLADAWDHSRAFVRLEWDPLMICAPPPLRYALLATARARRRLWDECGHALGAGWAWFSAKVCRRMAASTFLRWASLQHDRTSVCKLLEPFMGKLNDQLDPISGTKGDGSAHDSSNDADMQRRHVADGWTHQREEKSVKFRCGRSDAVTLSFEAATDIYETVQRWHNQEHREMMRMHFKGCPGAQGGDGEEKASQTASGAFSATPTLDAAEAAMSAADSVSSGGNIATAVEASTASQRGSASRHIEEAQLRLALELSKTEAEALEGGARQEKNAPSDVALEKPELQAPPPNSEKSDNTAKEEPVGLVLRAEGSAPAMVVYVKEHCLAASVDSLPERFEASIESIVHKMMKSSMWVLLYESITEELTFRAKLAAEALCAANTFAIDDLLSTDISVAQERMCLPVWRSSNSLMLTLSRLRPGSSDEKVRQARTELVRQASLEWCEHEDLTAFLDAQLQPLELEIDNFRGMHDGQGGAHTPHVADVGRLMFRNFCLLDSRVFRPLCLASYALVHELHAVEDGQRQTLLLESLEGLHAMLAACDVADDHLSASNNTKETFEELLLSPITTALERYAPWDIRGHPATDGQRRGKRLR